MMNEKRCHKCKNRRSCALDLFGYFKSKKVDDLFRILNMFFGVKKHELAEKCILYEVKKEYED